MTTDIHAHIVPEAFINELAAEMSVRRSDDRKPQ